VQQKRVNFYQNWDEKNKRYNSFVTPRLFPSELYKKYQYVLLHIAFLKVILLPHFETISVFAFQVEIRDLYYIHTG